ncbi:hypothetical protein PBCVAN69C_459R [Paramecium bursaria Chlorella virus AN69C]|uniref:Uncharacterized protein n=2 Tax=Chlorovirus TaxID=181083 RepID=Q98455_PBCV1|nr:hypothetical protein PBCV1_A403R [Paramecium bursaria Chlorella virus 1]AGE48505.1 hypothetical protein PBCVAN69C_459R [Paramecium bursaria Chlorella virus AN69C]AGE51541.1 hypothetical protein PBCVCviKI_436R [Paramecium bursaria Chlorella virus CviKI]AGE52559.1 hypothetical protein PBCVCvsA1_452R [Paramecium bursaria Chlorella virus CvsA1]AGE53915.1 hypothetical protein PBCVIL3A_454R [Paramecium bursaria Chlorella virus IL3A]AGE54608.1 hypothetical protein PBCVKS1B_384R [Paramecium bursari
MSDNSRDISSLTPEQQKLLARAVFEQWDKDTTKMKEEAEKLNFTKDTKVDPKDIGVRFGPVLDEATFKEYQRRKHGRLNVISAEQLQKMMGKK